MATTSLASASAPSRPGIVGFAWDAAWVVITVIATIAVIVGGFLLGTMEGDIPHPPTAQESLVYGWGSRLTQGGALALIALAILVPISAFARFAPGRQRGVRATGAVLALCVAGVLCFATYFAAMRFFVGALT